MPSHPTSFSGKVGYTAEDFISSNRTSWRAYPCHKLPRSCPMLNVPQNKPSCSPFGPHNARQLSAFRNAGKPCRIPHLGADSGTTGPPTPGEPNTSLMISPVGCERKSRYTGGVSVIVLRIRLLWNYINSCADPQARRVCRGYPVSSEENRWGAGHESP